MVEIAGCGERWDRVDVVTSTHWRAATDAVLAAVRLIAPEGQSLTWLDEPCALATADPSSSRRLGIRIRAYTLVVLDQHAQLVKTLPLSGVTSEETEAWLAKQGFVGGTGAPVSPPGHEPLANLDRALSNVYATVGCIARRTEGSSVVVTAPQTLQTTTTIQLSTREGEPPRLIVVGFSPERDQGVLFVRTEPGDGAALDFELTLRDVALKSDVDAQAKEVELFFRESLDEAYASLNRSWRSKRHSAP
jgi:hypothetical protein